MADRTVRIEKTTDGFVAFIAEISSERETTVKFPIVAKDVYAQIVALLTQEADEIKRSNGELARIRAELAVWKEAARQIEAIDGQTVPAEPRRRV